ncbi:MAG: CAP domain-containing protein [Brumimicrobium sp.]|nr:CAP domain-containing protein [Brumimicrobium sp.]
MLKVFLFSFIFLVSPFGFSQGETEKKVLNYINQVRTNPQKFLEEIAKPYIKEKELDNNRYARSLIRELTKLTPRDSLSFDPKLQLMAEKFREEAGRKGILDHVRIKQRFDQYAPHVEITGENLQFGFDQALDIVMDLLIDEDIPDAGHRRNILDSDFSVIGIAVGTHKTYDFMTVMEFGGFSEDN